MAVWLPVLKASLPYIAQIVTTAVPAFTSRSDASKVDPLVSQQIEELQSAATKNAESIHILAERLQQTIEGIDSAAASLQKQVALFKVLLLIASSTAVFALVVALWALQSSP
jgi:hypothetical protein